MLVVLKAYPNFRDSFLDELELAYNLGEPDEVTIKQSLAS